MAQEWDVDLSELEGLQRWYNLSPRKVQVASAMYLNNIAFGARDEAIVHLGRVMVVRNAAFVRSRLRVTKTAYSTPISAQRTIVGSVGADRFTGWKEQEEGAPVERKRISTLASRGGNMQRQMIPRSRLKPSAEVVKLGEQGQKGGPGNWGGAVAMLMRKKYKGLINIKGRFYILPGKGGGFVGPGRIGSGADARVATGLVRSLMLMQATKKEQPKRIPWLRDSVKKHFQKNPPQWTWQRTVSRVLKPPPKR